MRRVNNLKTVSSPISRCIVGPIRVMDLDPEISTYSPPKRPADIKYYVRGLIQCAHGVMRFTVWGVHAQAQPPHDPMRTWHQVLLDCVGHVVELKGAMVTLAHVSYRDYSRFCVTFDPAKNSTLHFITDPTVCAAIPSALLEDDGLMPPHQLPQPVQVMAQPQPQYFPQQVVQPLTATPHGIPHHLMVPQPTPVIAQPQPQHLPQQVVQPPTATPDGIPHHLMVPQHTPVMAPPQLTQLPQVAQLQPVPLQAHLPVSVQQPLQALPSPHPVMQLQHAAPLEMPMNLTPHLTVLQQLLSSLLQVNPAVQSALHGQTLQQQSPVPEQLHEQKRDAPLSLQPPPLAQQPQPQLAQVQPHAPIQSPRQLAPIQSPPPQCHVETSVSVPMPSSQTSGGNVTPSPAKRMREELTVPSHYASGPSIPSSSLESPSPVLQQTSAQQHTMANIVQMLMTGVDKVDDNDSFV